MIRALYFCVGLLLALLVSCSSDDKPSGGNDSSGNSDNSEFADCTYLLPGDLIPNSGEGVFDTRYWAPNMISPISPEHKAVASSQIYNPGGSASNNPDECAAVNFEYSHRDTFCESRSADRDSYNCPRRTIHQGIDINAGSRESCLALQAAKAEIRGGASPSVANLIPIVAVMDGTVSYIGRYTVDLRPSEGPISRFRYLHLNMRTLNVEFGSDVSQGDVIGYYYDDFGGNATTFHLHFEVIAFVDGTAQYVSPYASFILAEEKSKGIDCVRES